MKKTAKGQKRNRQGKVEGQSRDSTGVVETQKAVARGEMKAVKWSEGV